MNFEFTLNDLFYWIFLIVCRRAVCFIKMKRCFQQYFGDACISQWSLNEWLTQDLLWHSHVYADHRLTIIWPAPGSFLWCCLATSELQLLATVKIYLVLSVFYHLKSTIHVYYCFHDLLLKARIALTYQRPLLLQIPIVFLIYFILSVFFYFNDTYN